MTTTSAPRTRRTWTTSGSRVEGFSDAVFAISLTLLVLDLRIPADGDFPQGLLDEWPAYLAYLTSFLTIGAVWLNHHAVFSRLRAIDSPTMLLNLGLLLGVSLVPWPTGLLAAALRSGARDDQFSATAVYVLVTVIVAIPWATLNLRMSRRPADLRSPADAAWMRSNGTVSASFLVTAGVEVAIALVAPLVTLVILFLAPIVSLVLNTVSGARADDEGSPATP